ncbi:MAG: hypothetical protein ACLFNL_06735 [Bacteroidales bacterium]
MKVRTLFSISYLVALAFLLLYFLRDDLNLPENLSSALYYAAIVIFIIGVIRIFVMIVKRN